MQLPADLKMRSKFWLELDGELVFGDGKAELLRAIDETGSLSAAARQLEMSYRRAWGYICAIEKRLGKALVKRAAGGKGGGGACLTDAGRELLSKYDVFRAGIDGYVHGKFERSFHP